MFEGVARAENNSVQQTVYYYYEFFRNIIITVTINAHIYIGIFVDSVAFIGVSIPLLFGAAAVPLGLLASAHQHSIAYSYS
jgi:hypothetical protein